MSEQEELQLEVAAPAPEVAEAQPEVVATHDEISSSTDSQDEDRQENKPNRPAAPSTKAEVIVRLKEYLQEGEAADRSVTDQLKSAFFRIRNEEIAAARQVFIEAGGQREDFEPAADAEEMEFKNLMNTIKEQRAKAAAEAEAERQSNLERKLAIIEQIKEMTASGEDIDKHYDAFKALQTEWKGIGPIPAEQVTDTWKNYHHNVEQFYDLLRMNHEMRAYDFKKNLEIKTALCETAEKLAEEEDVVSAFHQLQKLHEDFRECGPVAKEERETIWMRFKAASTTINKRHQDHFLAIKQQEEENLLKKQELCDKVEALNYHALKTVVEWDAMVKEVIALQAEWKAIGYTPRKISQDIFERFRKACDAFFNAKTAHFRLLRSELAENLAKKTTLCEQAEALKDSTDWASTTDALVKLQAEWKNIGPVAHKVSDAIWKRFHEACNTFFDRKKEANTSNRDEEVANLGKKKDIIARLEQLAETGSDKLHAEVKALQAEWNTVGHVPFRKKEKIYRQYRAVCDKLYEVIGEQVGRRRIEGLVRSVSKGGNERTRLQRIYEEKKQEIANYETNLGFLTTKSKQGNSLVADIERRINMLKADLDLLAQKIAELAD